MIGVDLRVAIFLGPIDICVPVRRDGSVVSTEGLAVTNTGVVEVLDLGTFVGVVLADPAGFVAAALEVLTHVSGPGQEGAALVGERAVFMRVAAGEDGLARGNADGPVDEGVLEEHAFARHAVEIGRAGIGMAEAAHGVAAHLVAKNKDDVGWRGGRPGARAMKRRGMRRRLFS